MFYNIQLNILLASLRKNVNHIKLIRLFTFYNISNSTQCHYIASVTGSIHFGGFICFLQVFLVNDVCGKIVLQQKVLNLFLSSEYQSAVYSIAIQLKA